MHDLQKWLNSYPPCAKHVLPCVTLESVSQAEYIPPSFLFWWGQLKSESMRYQLRPSEPVCFHFLTLTPVLSTGHPLTSLLESERHGAEPRFLPVQVEVILGHAIANSLTRDQALPKSVEPLCQRLTHHRHISNTAFGFVPLKILGFATQHSSGNR